MNLSDQLDLKIGLDGISCTDFATVSDKILFAVGTCNGRIRIYDYMNQTEALLQKRWHKTIRCLSFFPKDQNLLTSASRQSGLKIHDIIAEKQTWSCLKAHEKSPISSILVLEHGQWVTGDEDGIIKMWDARKSGPVAVMIPDVDNRFDDLFNSINEMTVSSNDSHGTLLAAVDDGTLAVYNIRRRRFEMSSETLGFSARTLTIVKNNTKVLVGSDEGVVSVFNWNEFGNICDRFPIHPLRPSKQGQARTAVSGVNSVEKIVKITEDIVAVATDDGVISAINILPNRLLGCVGCHTDAANNDASGADCLSLSVHPTENIIASTYPANRSIKFWDASRFIKHAKNESMELRLPKHQRKLPSAKLKGVKSRRLCLTDVNERMEYLNGLLPEKIKDMSSEEFENSSSNEDSSS
ncbi:WD repeat-containing protein 55 [Schistosoma japonicum]|nr:WD repeat-containing protein 55 [Schistosoma japonicum]KAH8857202.1 WD repeat-containing protein 55 [Schistosoma japonicum]KAH8857203.1 WD repeat-containing protein 55 [Schistosoma japonicum]